MNPKYASASRPSWRSMFLMLSSLLLAIAATPAHASQPGAPGKFEWTREQVSNVDSELTRWDAIAERNGLHPLAKPDNESEARSPFFEFDEAYVDLDVSKTIMLQYGVNLEEGKADTAIYETGKPVELGYHEYLVSLRSAKGAPLAAYFNGFSVSEVRAMAGAFEREPARAAHGMKSAWHAMADGILSPAEAGVTCKPITGTTQQTQSFEDVSNKLEKFTFLKGITTCAKSLGRGFVDATWGAMKMTWRYAKKIGHGVVQIVTSDNPIREVFHKAWQGIKNVALFPARIAQKVFGSNQIKLPSDKGRDPKTGLSNEETYSVLERLSAMSTEQRTAFFCHAVGLIGTGAFVVAGSGPAGLPYFALAMHGLLVTSYTANLYGAAILGSSRTH